MSSQHLNVASPHGNEANNGSPSASTSGSTSTTSGAYTPSRRPFTHASTFTSGMAYRAPAGAGAGAGAGATNVRVFDADADLDHVTAQQRSDLQRTARQVRLSVSKGYCTSTPQHTRSSSFASTTAPSSEHPDIDSVPSSAYSPVSTITSLPFGRSAGPLPWSRTQSLPVGSFVRPPSVTAMSTGLSPSDSSSSLLLSKNRLNELEPFGSRPQRLWDPTLSTQSAFVRQQSSSARSHITSRLDEQDDEKDEDITAISIMPVVKLGKAGDEATDMDAVLGAHFEADEAFESGFGLDRRQGQEDRQGSSSDEEDGGNSSTQSEDEMGEPGPLSASAGTVESASSAPPASGPASPQKQRHLLAGSSKRPPLSTRPNGLASKTMSMPAGPFDAANRIDEAFAARTVLRHGLENRSRTSAYLPVAPATRTTTQSVEENLKLPWSPRQFERWASSSDF